METNKTGYTYRWLKDDILLRDGPDYEGTNTPKLTVKHASSLSSGLYTCMVDGINVNEFLQILSKLELLQTIDPRVYVVVKRYIQYTVVSRVSAHGRLNITHDFGLHGRLPRIKISYVCIEAATVAPCGTWALIREWALAQDTMVIT